MKLVQGLKRKKEIIEQIGDLQSKICKYSVDEDDKAPIYGTVEAQKAQIKGWQQSIRDLNKELENLTMSIQKTNLITSVTIRVGEVDVTKPIAAWIERRRTGASFDYNAWSNLQEKVPGRSADIRVTKGPDGKDRAVATRLYWDATERDKMMKVFKSEISLIDGALEVVNAETELISILDA